MLFAGFLLVIVSFFGCLWLSGLVGIDLYWPMAALWGAWAAIDAKRHDLKRYERVFPLEPWALLVAVTVMWPVALPWYLRLRHRVRTGRLQAPTRPSRARYVLVALAFLLPFGALALPKLLEQLPSARQLQPLERAATSVAGEPVNVSLDSDGTLTLTVFHRPDPRELHEERRDVAHRIAEAVVEANDDPEAFRIVTVAFVVVEGPPGMTVTHVGDVFHWRVSDLQVRRRVTI
jgi:hypothetical protein